MWTRRNCFTSHLSTVHVVCVMVIYLSPAACFFSCSYLQSFAYFLLCPPSFQNKIYNSMHRITLQTRWCIHGQGVAQSNELARKKMLLKIVNVPSSLMLAMEPPASCNRSSATLSWDVLCWEGKCMLTLALPCAQTKSWLLYSITCSHRLSR